MKQRLTLLTILSLVAILLSVALTGCSSSVTPAAAPSPSSSPIPETPNTQGNNHNSSGSPAPNNNTNPSPPPINIPNNGTMGTLADIQGNVLTLTIGQGTVTVMVASDTIVQETTAGLPSDLHQGQFLTVMGTLDENNNIIATSISIQPQSQGLFNNQPSGSRPTPNPNLTPLPSDNQTRPGGFAPRTGDNLTNNRSFGQAANGNITNINGNTLILSNTQETVTVILTSNTTIQQTVTDTISDLKTGQLLNVFGSRDANGNILATSIMVQNQRLGGRTPIPGASQ